MNGESLGLTAAGAALGLVFLGFSLHLRRKQRLLDDLPTSKTHGVFIGLVELKGAAECEAPLRGFLSERACVHYRYTVEEHWSRTVTETYTDKDGKTRTRTRHESGWKNVDTGGEETPFYLRDDTGAVRVQPAGAKIEPLELFSQTVERGHPLYYGKGPAGAVSHSDHRRRFVECGIPLHAPLYLVGQARERADVVAPEIAADKEAPLFLISTRTEEKVKTGFSIGSWVCWTMGLLATPAGFAVVLYNSTGPRDPAQIARQAGGLVAGYLLLWGLCWVWMAYNSLVSLRQRVRQGWSLIDVQLKRRHDLIPNLAAAVAGLSAHERETQTAVAALRAQQTATPPGVAGPDYAGVAGALRAVVERYPQLMAQESFARLHRELVETEQRIALARTYYNDIATQFATRLEQVPDRWVSALGAMRPEPLLQAADFERATVTVKFAD
ncbi:MAG: LemA family protein [Opitutae bacterium]|nr:LemA family protein [Opitutae bacterium]